MRNCGRKPSAARPHVVRHRLKVPAGDGLRGLDAPHSRSGSSRGRDFAITSKHTTKRAGPGEGEASPALDARRGPPATLTPAILSAPFQTKRRFIGATADAGTALCRDEGGAITIPLSAWRRDRGGVVGVAVGRRRGGGSNSIVFERPSRFSCRRAAADAAPSGGARPGQRASLRAGVDNNNARQRASWRPRLRTTRCPQGPTLVLSIVSMVLSVDVTIDSR